MWELEEIDFENLYNYVIENPNSAYTISLLEIKEKVRKFKEEKKA